MLLKKVWIFCQSLSAIRKQHRTEQRKPVKNNELQKVSAYQTVTTAIIDNSLSPNESGYESSIVDNNFATKKESQPRSHCRSKKTGDTLTLLHNFAGHPEFVLVMKREKISFSIASQLMSKSLKSVSYLILCIHSMFKGNDAV